MSRAAIITEASQGIGAGLADAFRRAGYAVVATARSIRHSDEPDLLTVAGDIAEAETSQRVVDQALGRFGRIDSLINTAGVFIGKPFTEYTPDDYAAITAVNLAGFFHITQRAIRQMVTQGGGHIVNVTTSLVDQPDSKRPSALASLTKKVFRNSFRFRVVATARSSRPARCRFRLKGAAQEGPARQAVGCSLGRGAVAGPYLASEPHTAELEREKPWRTLMSLAHRCTNVAAPSRFLWPRDNGWPGRRAWPRARTLAFVSFMKVDSFAYFRGTKRS